MQWVLSVGAMVVAVVSWLSQGTGAPLAVGGIRFDADPGMCEADTEWAFLFFAHLAPDHPDNRSTSKRPLPTSPTCQTEVWGLAPGPYVVRVVPARRELPTVMTTVEVRAGMWSTARLARPPVVVRGRITSNGEPVPGVQVDIRSMALPPITGAAPVVTNPVLVMAIVQSITDNEGRYALGLGVPGTYRQTLRETGQFEMPGVPSEVELRVGVNDNDIEIGGGTLRVWLTERGASMSPDRPVTLTVQSLPQPPKRPLVANPSEPFELRLITPGRYIVSATAQSVDAAGQPVTLVAAQQKEVVIAQRTTTDVSIDLIERDEMWLDVSHADGTALAGAYVVPYPGTPSLRTDDHGRVSLRSVPIGTRLPIRTQSWGITCHTVTTEVLQRVVVPDASETLILTSTKDNNAASGRRILGGATIAGLPGATCPVPYEALSVGETRGATSVDFKIQLPPGAYTLTLLDGRVLQVTAPGRLEIR